MNIGFDLDGVLYPWQKAAYKYLEENNYKVRDYDTFWKAPNDSGVDREKLKWLTTLPFLYNRIVVDREVVDSVIKLHNSGHSLYYITGRPPIVTMVTEKFLRDYGFPQDLNLIFDSDKLSHIRRLEIDVYIEDQIHNIHPLIGSCKLYCFEQPWNIDFKEDLEKAGVTYVKSIPEFSDRLLRN